MRVAFLGLGVMGCPMAGHLARSGHTVTVYNRTLAKAERWVAAHGGKLGKTPAEAAAGAEIVFSCVGNDDDLRQVVLGPQGAFAGMASGAILVDHTTASAVMDHYGRAVTLMGPAGSGQLTKMVNQICIAGLVQGLSEGLQFAVNSGLDAGKVVEVISKGAAQSWQMENRAKTMLEGTFDFGFAVDWMRKDLGICLAEARRNKSALPVTALVDQLYARVQERGGGRWDTSSLIDLLRRP
jgi:3-hydroxyisobutyrate dehydrogenase